MSRALVAAVTLVAIACSSGERDGTDTTAVAAEGGGAPSGAAGPTGDAVVSGRVRFTGAVPANPTIDMSEEKVCAAKYTSAPVDSQYVVRDGGLGNVFVYVKSGLPQGATYPAPTEPVVIDQNGCEYRPRVLGLRVGQALEIRNSDPVLHNIKAVPSKNRGFNISQPSAGMKTTRTFTAEEVPVPFECNVHGWMKGFAGVLPHPFFATTKPDGSFEIRGLPAGTYVIEAWHEKAGTQTTTVTVGAGETKTAELTFGTAT